MTRNKPTCWFFGDSFTSMEVLQKNGEYYKVFGETTESWTSMITNYFGGVERNFGFGGKSNQRIIDDAYNELLNIKVDDLVFIGSTVSTRIEGVNFFHNRMTSFNTETYHAFNIKDDDGVYDVAINEEDRETLVNYLHTFIYTPIEVWDRYWHQRYLVLKRNIENQGAKVVYWTKNLWTKFSTVEQESNGKSIDDHWGKVGNEQFYHYIIDNIEQNNTVIGLE